jgi:pimeloyl-ACP methyl ester carboxylesterase
MPADSDEPLVLVPGLGCTERLFAPQIAALRGSRAVQVADHRRDDTVAAIARRLLGEAPPRFALAGLSMGGYVALEVLRQAPDRVTRLALLDTSARPDTDEARQRRSRHIGLAEAGRLRAVTDELWPLWVHPDRHGDRDLKALVEAMMDETGAEAFVRQQRANMGREDRRDLLSALEIPTLVLVGEADAVTPPELAREMADLVEWSSLVVVPSCGHLSTLERPDAVSDGLRAWLAR